MPEATAPETITRITIEPGKRGGKSCIRGLRITVWDVLGWLGAGITEDQILEKHRDLEKADFQAVHQFAAEIALEYTLIDSAADACHIFQTDIHYELWL